MRFGLSVPNFAEPDRLLDIARAAEASGWDGWFLWDHILIDREHAIPVSEPWTVLAAAAIATSRIRLGTMVTPLARRRPWVLARQVTTVDHLSKGRAVLGVGLGVPPEAEYAPFGESSDPKHHAALVDEGLTVVNALWHGEPVTHSGPAFKLDGVQFAPRPVQQPRVPIWSACSLPARAGVRRAARWDGIVPIYATETEFRPASPEEVAAAIADIAGTRGRWTTSTWRCGRWPTTTTRIPRTSRRVRRGSLRARRLATAGSMMPPAWLPTARPADHRHVPLTRRGRT